MDYSIIFSSRTGNTAKIAGQIREALGEDSLIFSGITGNIVPLTPLVFVGFWTEKGSCDKPTEDLLAQLDDRMICLFGTAGFGCSNEYFESIIEKAKSFISPTSVLLDSFMCQGKMPLAVREKYVELQRQTPDDNRIQLLIDNFDYATTHPDEQDFDAAKKWAKSCVEKASEYHFY